MSAPLRYLSFLIKDDAPTIMLARESGSVVKVVLTPEQVGELAGDAVTWLRRLAIRRASSVSVLEREDR